MKTKLMLSAILFLGFTACTPKVYVIDSHTVLEDEAAGEWPQFDKDRQAKSAEKGPVPFPKVPTSGAEERLFNVLNGEMVGTSQLGAPAKSASGK